MERLDTSPQERIGSAAPKPLVITDVQTQKKRTERRSIFVNDEFAFGVSEECYVKYALFKGREVTQDFLDDVLRAEEHYQARQCAMRMIGRRMRSAHEVRTKLKEKEFPSETIDATLEFLRGYGMIDDDAFARAFVNDQLMRRPVGRRKLEQELRSKGIDKEAAGCMVLEIVDDDGELLNAIVAAEKKVPTLRQEDAMKRERALSNFLAARGFGWGVVAKVVKQFQPVLRSGVQGVEQSEHSNDR